MRATGFHKGMRVGSDDVYDASGTCPVCGSTEPRTAIFNVQSDPDIDMLKCLSCGALSASRMPKENVLNRYYSHYYSEASVAYTLNGPDRFARHILHFMPDIALDHDLRILDFGGGDGSLAIAVARALQNRTDLSVSVTIDLVDYASPRDSESSGVLITGHKELADVRGGFDIILASAILEHIPDANSAIRMLTGSANRRAYLYARTPFVLPIARLIRGIDITYPAHVHDMGSAFWSGFTRTFELDACLVSSRPSLVETTMRYSPVRTALAHAMKLPAHIELALFGKGHHPLWSFVGGWEAVVRFN
jgi:2-polyprenyl-3-methyl-5-hydroxy-6-metoxy-1,4-benzoquinol methylase